MNCLLKKRTVWLPTALGWLAIAAGISIPVIAWCYGGEQFLAHRDRRPAEALVVEGWIGMEGIRAAHREFEQGGYRYVIVVGGVTNNRWGTEQWNYAIEGAKLLRNLHVPPERIVVAPARVTGNRRTYEAAVGAREALAKAGLAPRSVNVFTIGVHARRSRLVFAKVLPATIVGVIPWTPADYHMGEPWWNSSERAEDMIKETVGYFFELLLNSGRTSNDQPGGSP